MVLLNTTLIGPVPMGELSRSYTHVERKVTPMREEIIDLIGSRYTRHFVSNLSVIKTT